jgi:hypothetical protein
MSGTVLGNKQLWYIDYDCLLSCDIVNGLFFPGNRGYEQDYDEDLGILDTIFEFTAEARLDNHLSNAYHKAMTALISYKKRRDACLLNPDKDAAAKSILENMKHNILKTDKRTVLRVDSIVLDLLFPSFKSVEVLTVGDNVLLRKFSMYT